MEKVSEKQLKIMKEVTQLFAPSGFEKEVSSYLKSEFKKHNLEIIYDNLGSIFGVKKSKIENAKKVMICAHMDEVGFIVKSIQSNGTVKVLPLGGHTASACGAQRVTMKINEKYIHGTTQIVPPHLGGGEISIDDMIFDFGFNSETEAKENGVYIGAPIVIDGEFTPIENTSRIISKAWDDRYGIIMIIDILDELDHMDLPFDLYIGGTVQEEVGCRGASTSATMINPDLAIVLDCSPAKDDGKLGGGVLIRYFDRSMIAFPELLEFQKSCIEKVDGKYQYFYSTGGTDAGFIHKTNNGILTLTHCLCAQSIHSPSSILDTNDYLVAKDSLLEILKELNLVKFNELINARR